MKIFLPWLPKRAFIGASLLLLLTSILVACSLGSATTSTSGPGSSKRETGGGSSTPTPGVQLGGQPCPGTTNNPSYWDPLIPTQPGTSQVAAVRCAFLIGASSLQALVNVAYQGTGQILDTYVYTDITSAHPSQIFKLAGLYKGDARISGISTIITNEVDGNSSINKGQINAVLMRDLSREFRWSKSAARFIQIAFPAIFPDLTRYQAEADQQDVNQGDQPWKRDAAMTAQACAEYFLKWFPHPSTTVQSGGGPQDAQAVVLVKSPDSGGGTITISLSRLEGDTNGGIWEVTSVESGNMSITTPRNGDLLSQSVSIAGIGSPSVDFTGESGFATVTVLDHLYDAIGYNYVFGEPNSSDPSGKTSIQGMSSYNSSFSTGIQEGVVAIYVYHYTSNAITGAVLIKVLLGATSF